MASRTGTRTDKATRKREQQERQRQAAAARQRAGRRRLLFRIGGALAALLAILAAVLYSLRGGPATTASGPAIEVAAAVGPWTAALSSPPTGAWHPAPPVLRQNGKPELLFVGAQYCPHCAGQRWAVVKALAQFGTFTGVTSSTDASGSVPTFDLLHAGYRSAYVAFDHKDLEDRNYHSLQSLTPDEQNVFNRLDPTGGIPLVIVGGYDAIGDGYNLADVSGLHFADVEQGLRQRGSEAFVRDINGEANTITALICHTDGMKPSSVCDRPSVRHVLASLR